MRALKILLGVGYPLLAFAALTAFPARQVALVLGAALTLRAIVDRRWLDREQVARVLPVAGLVGGVIVLAAIFDNARFLLFVPALVNAALLIAFMRTLHRGPSMVETLARWQGYRISSEKIGYCRRVTAVWCGFFLLNGSVILWLALYGTLAWWTLYTGVVAYVLVAVLFTAEIVYRAWRYRDYRATVVDRSLRAVFPPRDLGR